MISLFQTSSFSLEYNVLFLQYIEFASVSLKTFFLLSSFQVLNMDLPGKIRSHHEAVPGFSFIRGNREWSVLHRSTLIPQLCVHMQTGFTAPGFHL